MPVNRQLRAGEIRPILDDVATLGKLALATDAGTEAGKLDRQAVAALLAEQPRRS